MTARRSTLLATAIAVVGGGLSAVFLGPPIGLAVTVLLALVVVTVLRPWLGVAVAGVFCLVNGLVTIAAAALDPTAALLIGASKDVVLATLLVLAFATGRIRRVRPELVILVLAFVTAGALAGVGTPNLEMAAYGWRNDFAPLLLAIAVPAMVDRGAARRVAWTIAIGAQVAGLIAVVTWMAGLDWLYLIGRLPVSSPEEFPTSLFSSGSLRPRAFSPMSAPNEMALTMLVVLSIVWCLDGIRTRVRLALSALPLLAIALSASRSGYLGVAVLVTVLVYMHLHHRHRIASIVLAAVGLTLVVTAGAVFVGSQLRVGGDSSVHGHAASVGEALTIIAEHPWGLGLGEVGPRAIRYNPDAVNVESFWLLLALEAGIVALLIYIAVLVRVVSLTLWSSHTMARTASAAIAATLVSQLVLPTLQDAAAAQSLWIAVGLGLVALRAHDAEIAPGWAWLGRRRPRPQIGPRADDVPEDSA